MGFSIKNLATASTFLSIAQGAVMGKRALSGQATTYGGNTHGGACSFSTYTLPSNMFGTALSDSNWATASQCGRCVSVTGPSGNSITAMITDECPGCGTNHLDLYTTAFTSLAPLSKGIIDVTWNYVDCPITSPLQLHLKEGVSAYWFSMQVVNAAEGVSKLDVSTDGGKTWQPTNRTTYNYFEHSAGYGSKVNVRVTGLSGKTVTVNNVAVTPGNLVSASGNLGSGLASKSVASDAVVAKEAVVDASTTSATPAAVVTPASSSVAEVSTSAAVVEPVSSSSSSSIAEVSTSAAVTIPSASATQSVVWVDSDECETK
ncbi:uncharacterized protein EAF02_000045 [Botrytis sinoallii]|uniref:uncharacterized protein n=1 Tax=Botrytis sinoallii TaxID=1463999 RepID=UPI0019028AA5|nr:uncharacterized protein EAF02_000045 [Botrytis sinoallii]KAF7892507.1 hypothetical protein EAF02_000045 [Botrytis sinoallii]